MDNGQEHRLEPTDYELIDRLMDAAGMGVIHADLKVRLVRANRTAAELLGCSKEELLSMTLEIIDSDHRHGETSSFSDVVEGRSREARFDALLRKPDGSALKVGVWAALVRGPGGRPHSVVMVLGEIT